MLFRSGSIPCNEKKLKGRGYILTCRNPLTGLNLLQLMKLDDLYTLTCRRNPLTGLNLLQPLFAYRELGGVEGVSQSPYGAQSLAT